LVTEKKKEITMFENTYQNIELTCEDCGCTFVFTAEEQEFYAEKGFATPKRCNNCRSARKKQKMNNRKRYTVNCSRCGCETTVPFKPKEGKEVYCVDCYKIVKEEERAAANNGVSE